MAKKKKTVDYGSKSFTSGGAAYRAYEKARLMQTQDPSLAPKARFLQIWGWGRKKVAKPGQ